MSWFRKLLPKVKTSTKKGVPEGIWSKCPACLAILYRAELERNLYVCPKCEHHIRIGGRERINIFLDQDQREELATQVEALDRLKFRDSKKYPERIKQAQKKSGEKEAVIAMRGKLYGMPVVTASFDFNYIGGSMSAGAGERFVAAADVALTERLPFISFATSGGARMQEGLFSLFQMARTSAVLARLSAKGIPFISVLLDPTMGGVSASLAMLGDVIIAEPKALIGFSGPRVIEQTIRQTLPEGFQRSEFLLDHGAIDMIVDRRDLRNTIARLLANLTKVSMPTMVEPKAVTATPPPPDAKAE